MGYRLNAGTLPVFAMAYLCDALSLRLAPLGIFPLNFPVHIAGARRCQIDRITRPARGYCMRSVL
jgi:hypothetical protein